MSIYKIRLDANMQTSRRANFTNISLYVGMIVALACIIALI
ncbi:hypothetical protein [Halarcobacter ebronensis]|nr:hypothetical protein [Halarcobacter ebronensis]